MKIGKVFIVIGIVIACIIPGGVMAEVKPGSYFATPLIAGYIFDGDQNLKDDPAYGMGVGVGYTVDSHWAAEAVFNYIDTESTSDSSDVNTCLYRLNGLYHFSPYGKWMPYLAAGLGIISFDRDRGGSNSHLLFNYGAGLKYFLTETLALTGDVRHVISFNDTNNNLLYSIGLTYYFGGEKEIMSVAEEKMISIVDSDGDGIADDADQCPDTPPRVTVDARGCPQDSDGDGVPDSLDQCPRTPKGAAVNEVGCWVCKGLEFDFDKWDIKPRYYPVLDEAVGCMNQHPTIEVEIQGHTDAIGTPEYNQTLSEKRANEVMHYFIGKGISPERVTAVGYGLTSPIADNATSEGRAMNRRVQLRPVYE